MATANPTQQPAKVPNLPPEVGRSLSVRILDEGMWDDLRVIMQTGCDASAAVRQALLILANVYDGAWKRGIVPTGVAPEIVTANVKPHRPVRQPDQDV
ncbi:MULTISPECIES: hypothetical protein [Streptomyces]|uniref:Uncharacterized protein n=1 Tax=Streptomyces caeruleatus TaxID=661399 RepID=A0A101TPM9_9ACTN|nr:hypothetical protein [Streptomyces caeruleatus]KUN96187.1 hypothetical protein AQJ67_33640 [Streptomyces caeruleatus]